MEDKNDFVTKEYLDKKLDEKLGEHTQVLVSAIDGILTSKLEENKKEHRELGEKIDRALNAFDGYVKAQEEFKQEFVIMKEELRKIKDVIKEKLGVEIRAF